MEATSAVWSQPIDNSRLQRLEPPPNSNGSQQPPGPKHLGGDGLIYYRCKIDPNSVNLPECMNRYVKNGEVIDGSGKCQKKPKISSKTDAKTLVQKAEQIVRSGQCQSEVHIGEEEGESHGGRTNGRSWFRRKRQGFPTCGHGPGVGNCDNTTDQQLESIYIEKDLGDGVLIVTNGVPDHCYRQDMAQPISNSVCEHYRAVLIPKSPRKTNRFRSHPRGIVGLAKSGAFFYNHLSVERTCNIAAIAEKGTFDTCDGHADASCHYHYHKAPVCMAGFDTCGPLGYSNDGVPVYGKCTLSYHNHTMTMKSCYKIISGKNGCDASHYVYDPQTDGCNLDQANGFLFNDAPGILYQDNNEVARFNAGTYAYFFTSDYPFIMPGYYGDKSLVKWCVINV